MKMKLKKKVCEQHSSADANTKKHWGKNNLTIEIEGTMWDYTDFSYSTHLQSYNAVSHLCATVLERTSVKPKSANKVLSGIFLVGI